MRTRRGLSVLLVLAMMLAACTGSAEETPDTGDSGDTGTTQAGGSTDDTTGDDAAPVGDEGVFVHAGDDEPLSLDPAQVEAGEYGEAVILQVYDRLVEFTPDGPELAPGLAAEVPTDDNGGISADGLTYTFTLREGVTFHDGSPLTSDDVLFSWERAMTMDLPEGTARILTDNVASMEAPDDATFVVTLQAPNAAFLNSIVTASVASVLSREVVEANGGVEAGTPNEFVATTPIGTGPFEFVQWNRDENLIFEKNEDYYGQVPALDLRIEIVQDPDVRVLGLRAGEYDMIETDPSFLGDLEGAEGVVIYSEGLLLEPIHIGLNLNVDEALLPPEDTIPADFFHDPRVRQAFNYVFDYEAFLNGALGGFGDLNPHYIPQGIFGYDPEAPVYTQDLAKAEELFRETGWWDEGFVVTVVTEGANLFEIAALVLKDSIEGLNPNMQVRVAAVAEAQFDEAHASDPMPYAMWVKNADPFADPEAYMRAYAHPDGEWGQTHGFRNGYQNPDQIATLIDDAAQEVDEPTRAGMYSELQNLLFEDPMWIIAAQEGVAVAHRDHVQGFVHNPLWPRPNVRWNYFDK